ncbi:hypothetical protein BKA69DRAFT_1128477 [Paraphysoderma sedebokerense]|nr:hypothetical protein BKA69DRAFT_1128477 [Paraphysoderma sedebokerense]
MTTQIDSILSSLPPLPTINSSTKHAAPTNWLELETLKYTIPKEVRVDNSSHSETKFSRERSYEMCHRKKAVSLDKTGGRAKFDAVDVLALTSSKLDPTKSNRIICTVQYRPPVHAFVIEFPSGCIDPTDISVEETALRELMEETGYVGEILKVKPNPNSECKGVDTVRKMGSYDASVQSSCGWLVEVTVDLDSPQNAKPTQQLDDDEWSMRDYNGRHRWYIRNPTNKSSISAKQIFELCKSYANMVALLDHI